MDLFGHKVVIGRGVDAMPLYCDEESARILSEIIAEKQHKEGDELMKRIKSGKGLPPLRNYYVD